MKCAGVQAVAFDNSAQYLAVGGGDARVYGAKQDWAVLATFPDLPKKVPPPPPPPRLLWHGVTESTRGHVQYQDQPAQL